MVASTVTGLPSFLPGVNFQFFTALLGILLHHSVTIGGLMSGRQEQSYLVLEFLP